MKCSQPLRLKICGSALLVALVMGTILCLLLGSFLYLTQFEIKSVARSQQWNLAMVTAEAGMEEGLSMINRYANSGSALTTWPNVAAACGWYSPAANVYFLERTSDSANKYQIYITNLNSAPVIKAVGYTLVPNTTQYVARAIQVISKAQSYLLGGVLAKKGVKINDASTFDSYNSQDPNFSTAGQWDINKRRDNATVGSVSSNVVAAINAMGTAKIYGKIATGPTSGFSVSSGVAVGSSAWVNGGNKGVQPGWSRNDLNISVPDAPPKPAGTYQNMPAAGNNVVLDAGGGTVRYVKMSSEYKMSGTNALIITNGTVIIDFQSGIALSGSAAIQIATNAQLILFLGTENTQLDGLGVMNGTGNPTNFIVYGTSACKQIEINGSTTFVGYVYAPYADITLNGNTDVSGSFVGMSFQIDGKMRFHYDESLGIPQAGSSQYVLASWREVSPK